MKDRNIKIVLAAIFLLVLGMRLYYTFQTPYFTGSDAYFTIEQVEHILEKGYPNYYDELSYSGRQHIFMPLFHYILAFFSLLAPIGYVAKVLPNIFASSIVFMTYLAAREIVKSKRSALIAAFVSGFIPIYTKETINSISVYSLSVPLMFYLLYCFLRIDQEKYLKHYLIGLVGLSLISSSVIIFVLGLITYYILLKIERLQETKAEREVLLFSIFFVLWLEFIVYKKALMEYGMGIVWQNIPQELLSNYFQEVTVLGAIFMIGSLPLLYGIYNIYINLTKERNKKTYLIIGMVAASALLLWLKFISVSLGLIFCGSFVALLFSEFYMRSLLYLKKTKISKFRLYFVFSFIILFTMSSVIPSFTQAKKSVDSALSADEIDALNWIEENTDEDSTIIATAPEGILVNTISKRKNIIDSNFMMAPEVKERFKDLKIIYTVFYPTIALEILAEYEADYIFFSPKTKETYKVDEFKAYENKNCFEKVYDDGVQIFEVKCRITETSRRIDDD
ncbi:hypothetical protein ACFL0W_03035 [Nanoarchaeota archaeon]